PVEMITSDLPRACRIVSSRHDSSSPTMLFDLTSMPIELSRSVSQSELVSTLNGVSISEPIAMISALFIASLKEKKERKDYRSIDPGEDVIGHDSKTGTE